MIFRILLFIGLTLCSLKTYSNPQKYKYNKAKINGIEIIENPAFPRNGCVEYVLDIDISIGLLEGDEKYMFVRPRDFCVSDNGTIYILDAGANCIKVYDAKGYNIQLIGKKGKGPGEFLKPISMTIDKNENIYVVD